MKRSLLFVCILALFLPLIGCGQSTEPLSVEVGNYKAYPASYADGGGEPVEIAYLSTDDPIIEMLQSIYDSLEYDVQTGFLTFTIPDSAPEYVDEDLLIAVVGRLDGQPSWSQKWPYFTQAYLDGWVPGETYSGPVLLGNVDYIEIVVAYVKDSVDNDIPSFKAILQKDGKIVTEPVDENMV